MKLTIKRNQADVKGLFGGHKGVRFSLYGRCNVSQAEKDLITRYKVDEYVLAGYQVQPKNSEAIDFTITVSGIINGKTVDTGDIGTLQKLEASMKDGCRNLKNLLELMSTFGGEETFEI